jgi:subtilisin family serine protease
VDTFVPRRGAKPKRLAITRRFIATLAAMLFVGGLALPLQSAHESRVRFARADVRAARPVSRISADRLVVFARPGANVASAAHAVGAVEVGYDAKLGMHVWRVPRGDVASAVQRLRTVSGVVHAEADVVGSLAATPNDPDYPVGSYRGGQWGFVNVKAASAWDTSTGSPNVVIAIVDSGISAHPDLVSNLVAGHNVLDGLSDATDTLGHGTEAAGVAAATTNNATGVAGYCWTCELMPVKVTNTSTVLMSDVATGITWAADHGAKVISLSLSSTSNSSALSAAVSYAQSKGAVIVAAAGNAACNCPAYPAALPGVISVAGSDYYDNLYSWSSYGSWVSVAAPGQNLTTALKDPSTGAQWGYVTAAGTSFATPAVAGEAGLLAAAAPNASATDIVNAILAGVDPVAGANQVGHGRIDLVSALSALGVAGGGGGPAPTVAPPTTAAPAPTTTAAPATTTTVTAAPTTTTLAPAVTTTTVAPAPAPTTQTTTWTGSLNQRQLNRSFNLTTGAGNSHAKLSFNCATLTLAVSAGAITVGTDNGPSVMTYDVNVPAGTDSWTVSGKNKCSFTLTVTTPSP